MNISQMYPDCDIDNIYGKQADLQAVLSELLMDEKARIWNSRTHPLFMQRLGYYRRLKDALGEDKEYRSKPHIGE